MQPKFTNMKIAMECLFPDFEAGTCCPEKWSSSCNPGLARTIHRSLDAKSIFSRFINKDPEKFVDQFLPEISAKIGAILKNVLNSVLQSVESRYMIDSA